MTKRTKKAVKLKIDFDSFFFFFLLNKRQKCSPRMNIVVEMWFKPHKREQGDKSDREES